MNGHRAPVANIQSDILVDPLRAVQDANGIGELETAVGRHDPVEEEASYVVGLASLVSWAASGAGAPGTTSARF